MATPQDLITNAINAGPLNTLTALQGNSPAYNLSSLPTESSGTGEFGAYTSYISADQAAAIAQSIGLKPDLTGAYNTNGFQSFDGSNGGGVFLYAQPQLGESTGPVQYEIQYTSNAGGSNTAAQQASVAESKQQGVIDTVIMSALGAVGGAAIGAANAAAVTAPVVPTEDAALASYYGAGQDMTNAIAQYGGQTASTYLPGATAANASLLGESLTSNAIDVSSVNATEQGLADSFVNSLPGNSSSLWDSLPSIKDIGSGLGSAFDIFTKAVSGAAAGVGLYKAINPTTPKPLTTTPILTQNPYVTQPPGISGAGASNNPYSSTLKKASTMGDTSQVPGGTPMTGATPQTAIVSGGLNDSAAFPLLALFGLVIYIMHKRG